MSKYSEISDIIQRVRDSHISPDEWMWKIEYDEDNNKTEVPVYTGPDFEGIPNTRISDYATTSTGPELWIIRALAEKNSLKVAFADWAYFNPEQLADAVEKTKNL